MKTVIAILVILGVTYTTAGFVDTAQSVLDQAAQSLPGGYAGVWIDLGHAISNGIDSLFGLRKNGKAGYAGIYDYYIKSGIRFFPNFGCCSCPSQAIAQPGSPNYSPNSPFFINGVYKIADTEFCTCPPELIASAVQAAYYKPGILGTIDEYVFAIPRLGAQTVKNAFEATIQG